MEVSDLLVKLIRQIGVKRILYGSDGAAGCNLLPRENWEAFRRLKLTEKETKTIARNVAPFLIALIRVHTVNLAEIAVCFEERAGRYLFKLQTDSAFLEIL